MNPNFAVGDVARVRIGNTVAAGEVINLVGTDGAGTNLYRVEVLLESDPCIETQQVYPEEALEPVQPLDDTGPFSVTKVMEYLESGALTEILRRGDGGRSPLRVFLRNQRNGLIHSWIDDPDHLPGTTIPFQTVEPGEDGKMKIFPPAKPRIVLFLRGFGLSRDQATRVVDFFPVYRPLPRF